MKEEKKLNRWFCWGVLLTLATLCLVTQPNEMIIQANEPRSSHIGTFEGETTFSLSSNTGILPSIEIETKDVYGNIKQYQSDGGSLTIPDTKSGTMVKKAILKGRTLENSIISLGYGRTLPTTLVKNTLLSRALVGNCIVQPNKIYLMIVDLEQMVLDNLNSMEFLIQINYENGVTSTQETLTGYTTNNRRVYHKITPEHLTKSVEFKGMAHQFENNANGNPSLTVSGYMIIEYQEGMESWNIPYFEGTQSVKTPVLTLSNQDGSEMTEITLEEELVLRSNGAVYDELDLMTGKLTQRLDENNNLLDQEIIRYVKINSTHSFNQIKECDISVKGTFMPTLGSVTVPTEGLTFTLNPNLESDQQFIAPDFSISNESRSPIGVELKSFEQMTNVLNDVLPDKYESWEELNQKQSKDIALAVIPQASDRWISLNEGSYYVANTVNQTLGIIKGNSVVDFKFSALHGQAFSEPLTPQYKLTFVFEL